MSKGKKEVWYDISERFLGKNVGLIIPVLGLTSCMNREYREIVVILNHISKIDAFLTNNPSFSMQKCLVEIINPLMEDLGRANWPRDILTDLALALSQVKSESIDLTDDDLSLEEILKE